MYFLDEYKPQQRMHSRFILESSIAPQLYPSLIWATRYFQVTMFFSSPVFSGLFSVFYWEYFQCSNPIETHVGLASAMLLPPTYWRTSFFPQISYDEWTAQFCPTAYNCTWNLSVSSLSINGWDPFLLHSVHLLYLLCPFPELDKALVCFTWQSLALVNSQP